MKELSIEQKAKAYDEAIERAKNFIENGDESEITVAESIFAGIMEESDDERIRKEILDYIIKGSESYYDVQQYGREKFEKWIAWIEKQGEQKTEPKFQNGQWIVWQNKCYKVNDNSCGYKLIDQNGLSTSLEYGTINESARLWDITKDAIDGDVLCTYECDEPKIVFILKGTPKKHYALSYHCYYNIMYPHFGSDSEKGCLAPNDEDVKPATKEQYDTFFAKMKEAGYEWNVERKELRKFTTPDDVGFAELGKVWEEEVENKKSTCWSKEDEDYYNAIITKLEVTKDDAALTDNQMEFLKSLKDRIQLKQQDWSKEDEKEVAILEAYIRSKDWSERHIDRALDIVDELVNKVKSIRSQQKQE